MSYKNTIPLHQRESESSKILDKYPNCIPVIVETNSKDIILPKNKFLVPYHITASHLLYSIRKTLKVDPSKAIFMYYDGKIVCGSELLGEMYIKYKEKHNIGKNGDKFFYINLTLENTFG